ATTAIYTTSLHDALPSYSKDTLGDDFRTVRELVFPGDTRQLLDMRRSGAVEAAAGGADPLALSAKMANSIHAASDLQQTYLPARDRKSTRLNSSHVKISY